MPRIFRHYVPWHLLLLVAADSAIVFGSVYAGLALALLGLPEVVAPRGLVAPAAVVLTALVLAMADLAGLHDSRRRFGRRELLLRLALAFLGAYLGIAILGYFAPSGFLGRRAYLLSFLVSFPLSYGLRVAHDHITAHSRRRRRVLLLGSGPISRMIADAARASNNGYELTGCVDGDPARTGGEVNGVRVLGSMKELDTIFKRTRSDTIVVALEERRNTLPVAQIVECKLRGVQIEDWPDFYERLAGKIPVTNLRPSWLCFSDGFRKNRLTLVTKRAMDIVVSLAGCLVSLPLIVVIAVLVKLDSPGPVFFRQRRLGQGGRVFSPVKFRSMRVADDGSRPPGATGDQARVTRVGRLLRRTRLDELPQLFTVLRGEMSLVGPRPEWVALVPEFAERVPLYLHRLAVKPGITGWAQVRNPYGSSVENTVEKLQYDLYYIKNMSIFLDLLILLHTIQIVLFTRGSR